MKVNQHEIQVVIERYMKTPRLGYGVMIHREVGMGTIHHLTKSFENLNAAYHIVDLTLASVKFDIGASVDDAFNLDDIIEEKFQNGGVIVFDGFDTVSQAMLRPIFTFLDRAPRNILFVFTVRTGGIYLPSYFLNRVGHVEYEYELSEEERQMLEQKTNERMKKGS